MTATFQFINGFRAAKGVDPARVQQELEEVADIYGKLTAENVLLYAEQRPESVNKLKRCSHVIGVLRL